MRYTGQDVAAEDADEEDVDEEAEEDADEEAEGAAAEGEELVKKPQPLHLYKVIQDCRNCVATLKKETMLKMVTKLGGRTILMKKDESTF